jgi:hypothetical protein
MDEKNAVIVIEDESGAAELEPMNRDLIVRMGDTLMGIHPGAKDVGVIGMRAVAQLAIMTGANPLPGANGIHAWKDKDGKTCIQFGIGFWRGEAEKAGGLLWLDHPRPMTEAERKSYGVADGVLASIARAALKAEAFSLRADARKFGDDLTLREAMEQTARAGVGIAAPGEYAKKGRPAQWVADERAERDLLRKLCPIAQRQRPAAPGGWGWNAAQFARPDVAQLPDGYTAESANLDLFGSDEEE